MYSGRYYDISPFKERLPNSCRTQLKSNTIDVHSYLLGSEFCSGSTNLSSNGCARRRSLSSRHRYIYNQHFTQWRFHPFTQSETDVAMYYAIMVSLSTCAVDGCPNMRNKGVMAAHRDEACSHLEPCQSAQD
jgi:hypothetical protein